MLHGLFACKKGAVRSQRNDHPANARIKKFFGAPLRVIDCTNRNSSDGFRLTLIGHEIIEVADGLYFDGLSWRRIEETPNLVSPRKLHRVVNRLKWDFNLQNDPLPALHHTTASATSAPFE